MRYIKKLDTPLSFTTKTSSLTNWDSYHRCCNKQKRALRRYILKYEQNNLCIYCESKITHKQESSHLEHIKPKHLDVINLTFDYNNIAVSCNGNCHTEDKEHYSCGHRKDNNDTPYDDNLFLNPVKLKDIREYFEYDIDTGYIKESSKDSKKSKYMIETLHLNDGSLPLARKKALQIFIDKIKKLDISQRKNKIIEVLNKENIAFVSFLKFKYKSILET